MLFLLILSCGARGNNTVSDQHQSTTADLTLQSHHSVVKFAIKFRDMINKYWSSNTGRSINTVVVSPITDYKYMLQRSIMVERGRRTSKMGEGERFRDRGVY